jgi:hypothetical protein
MSENQVFVMETADILATLADDQEAEKGASPAAKGTAEAGPFGLLGEQPARQSGTNRDETDIVERGARSRTAPQISR